MCLIICEQMLTNVLLKKDMLVHLSTDSLSLTVLEAFESH
jgi:hypothetical protein